MVKNFSGHILDFYAHCKKSTLLCDVILDFLVIVPLKLYRNMCVEMEYSIMK